MYVGHKKEKSFPPAEKDKAEGWIWFALRRRFLGNIMKLIISAEEIFLIQVNGQLLCLAFQGILLLCCLDIGNDWFWVRGRKSNNKLSRHRIFYNNRACHLANNFNASSRREQHCRLGPRNLQYYSTFGRKDLGNSNFVNVGHCNQFGDKVRIQWIFHCG